MISTDLETRRAEAKIAMMVAVTVMVGKVSSLIDMAAEALLEEIKQDKKGRG